jgi:hypothetical protein
VVLKGLRDRPSLSSGRLYRLRLGDFGVSGSGGKAD